MNSARQFFTVERSYSMATCRKHNLGKVLDSRKKRGAHRSDSDCAKWLWKKVRKALKGFSPFELERIQRIRVEFNAHEECVDMSVWVKDASTKREFRISKYDDILLLSPARMKHIDRIMSAMLATAKQEGFKTVSYSDRGVVAKDELKYWMVKWTEQ